MTDIILLFPPDCREINEPCINTTELTAYLKTQEITVRQYDANIAFQNAIYSEQGFTEIQHFSEILCQKYEKQTEEFEWLSQIDKKTLLPLLQKACDGIKTEEGYYNFENYFRYKSLHYRYMIAIQAMVKCCLRKSRYNTLEDIAALISHGTPYDMYFRNTLVPELLNEKPLIVDIFVTTYGQLLPALILSSLLKQQGCYVVLSDILPTQLRLDILKTPEFFLYVDGVIIYEQEYTIPALLKSIKSKQPLHKVPNYIYINNGIVNQTSVVSPIEADNIPTPDFSGLDYSNYMSAAHVLPYSTSRGCSWGKCLFCHLHKGASKYVEKSVKKIVSDLQSMKANYGTDTVLFYDNLIRPDRLMDIANALLTEKVDIKWTAITKTTRLILPDEAQLLYLSGCRHLEFEVESINAEVHCLMQTGVNLDVLWESLKNTRKAGIINTVCLLYGCFGEGIEEFSVTNRLVLQHKDIVNAVIPFQFYVAKDSGLYYDCKKYGLNIKKTFPDLDSTYHIFEGDNWVDIQKRDEGAAELFRMTNTVYPHFQCSYFPIINYVCHYKCNDPLMLTELADHTNHDKNIIPKPHQFIIKLPKTVSSKNERLFNLINGKQITYTDELDEIMLYIDGTSKNVSDIIYSLADKHKASRGMAMLKYLPVLNQYRQFLI